jgi:hypothetical protein
MFRHLAAPPKLDANASKSVNKTLVFTQKMEFKKYPHWGHSCHLLPEKTHRAMELMQDFINSSYHA